MNQRGVLFCILFLCLVVTICFVVSAMHQDWQDDHAAQREIKIHHPKHREHYLKSNFHMLPHHKCKSGECILLPGGGRHAITKVIDPKDIEFAHKQHNEHLQRCGNCDDLPKFNPDLYNDPKYERYNNCYFYAFSDLNTTLQAKPQPGIYNHLKHLKKDELSCVNLMHHIKADHPQLKFIDDITDSCPCGYYKGVLMVSDQGPVSERDYHFAKQNSNMWFSHKPGSNPVTNVDASGNYILDPKKADWDYSKTGGVNYNRICSLLCIPNDPNVVYETESHEAPTDWESELATDYVTPPRSWSRNNNGNNNN
jgi:hypothetical protein